MSYFFHDPYGSFSHGQVQNHYQQKSVGGSRTYDAGKDAYGRDHRTYEGQPTRHYVSNETMEHYGVNPDQYAHAQALTDGQNYRMGDTSTNGRDTRLDNAFIGSVFRGQGDDYNAHELTQSSKSGNAGMNYQQQGAALGKRFEKAKDMYALTGDTKFYEMAKDYKKVASDNLTVDGRQWRMPKKK